MTFSVHLGSPNQLTRILTIGLFDIALGYNAELRSGPRSKYLMSYTSIYVARDPNHPGGLNEANVFIDWGREFVATHSRWHPDCRLSRTCLQIAINAVPCIIRNKKSTHLPYRMADDYIDTGLLHFVPDTPDMHASLL